jgi:dienelactone hydrolase
MVMFSSRRGGWRGGWRLGVGLCACLLTGLAAHAAGFERGPAPTNASLEAAAGPYAIASAKVASPDGYGSATVIYPTNTADGKFGLVGLAPGFISPPGFYAWLANRIASHGFVVISLGTKSLVDAPDTRGDELVAALKQVAALADGGNVPYAAVTDTSRQALMGHSAGGGGTLTAAQGNSNPAIKTALPMNPASTTSDFSGIKVPTLIMACEKDAIAPNKTYSAKYYPTLSASIDRAYLEVAAADHLCPTVFAKASVQNTVGKTVISWLKRYVDEDRRYTPFITGAGSPAYSKVDAHVSP